MLSTVDCAFASIPVMCVEPSISIHNFLIKHILDSDIGNVSTPEQRVAVAREIRDACINVGFFYSECLHLRSNATLFELYQSVGTEYLKEPSITCFWPWKPTSLSL